MSLSSSSKKNGAASLPYAGTHELTITTTDEVSGVKRDDIVFLKINCATWPGYAQVEKEMCAPDPQTYQMVCGPTLVDNVPTYTYNFYKSDTVYPMPQWSEVLKAQTAGCPNPAYTLSIGQR